MHLGPPLVPIVHLSQEHLENDAINHILNWSVPFTSLEFPIINYTIIIQLDGQPHTIVNSTTTQNFTYTSFGYNCYAINFSVVANNQVGRSEAVVIHSGHPIGM